MLKLKLKELLLHTKSIKEPISGVLPQMLEERRAKEERFLNNNPAVEFTTKKGDVIYVTMSYSESAKNVYYHLNVTVNGDKKTIAAVKKLLK